MRHWHDLAPGQTFSMQDVALSKQDIIDFALEFDPQPYHLDQAAAKGSVLGDLCASGWQVCALMMKLVTQAFRQHDITLLGVREVSALRWKIPVFVGDRLTISAVILSCHKDSDRAGLGGVNCDIKVHNQKQQVVVLLNSTLLVARAQTTDATMGAARG